MIISEIYKQYQIPPGLQNHQYRVAAVARLIAQKLKLDSDCIYRLTRYGLLHDMGNMVKADYLKPLCAEDWEDRERWQTIRELYRKKYGDSAHDVTINLITELGAGKKDLEFFENNRFGSVLKDNIDIEWKIAKYADLRVDPFGIVSLKKRISDIRNRYIGNTLTLEKTDREEKCAIDFEKELDEVGIAAEMINQTNCKGLIEELPSFDVIWK